MHDRRCMTEPPAVRAELADLGMATAGCQRPVMPATLLRRSAARPVAWRALTALE
jgi:hypothetical protein